MYVCVYVYVNEYAGIFIWCMWSHVACVGTHANQTVHAICHLHERSSSCFLGPLAYEVKLTIALPLFKLENSTAIIDHYGFF